MPTATAFVCSMNPARLRSVSRGSGTRTDCPRLERRVVDRRHEVDGEEGAHDLTDHVGGGDPRDAEPVRHLGGERALAHPGGAADEDHERHLQAAQ